MLAAAARREVGADAGAGLLSVVELIGSRIELAVNTVLEPVKTLLLQLTGQKTEEDGFPGSCVDSKCVSSTDIPIPPATDQVIFINLTGRALVLTDLQKALPLAYGPENGYVLDNARQVEMGFYTNYSSSTPTTMEWTDGTYTFSVSENYQGITMGVSSPDILTHTFDTPIPQTGTPEPAIRKTILLLPRGGTEITIPVTDQVGQAIVASALCGVNGSCDVDAVDEQVVYSAFKNVGNTLFNYGTVNSSNTYEVAHEVVKSNGIEENLKVAVGGSLKFSLGPFNFETEISAVIQQRYGHSWSDGVITKQGATVNVPPGSYGQIQLSYGEYHDTVDMTLRVAGVTINIPAVEFVSPVPADAENPDGTLVAPPVWTTADYVIGTGPDPYPNSHATPVAPTNTAPPVRNPTPPDIAAPTPAPAPARKPLGEVIGDFLKAETRALLSVPKILLTGSASQQLFSQGFEIVNLTPYPQKLVSISGDYEEDQSPEVGYVLNPYQMVRVEVDHSSIITQEAIVKWERNDGGPATVSEATLYSYAGGGRVDVGCADSACMEGAYDDTNQAGVMYIIQPSVSTFDLTADPNLAAAAIDAACYYNDSGQAPSSCGTNVTGQSYYTAPVVAPARYNYNNGSQENSFTETLTTYKSETTSWSAGAGIKLKEKSNIFLGQQIEIESTVLYTGSHQEKESETTTVRQNVPPYSTGTLSYGDAYLRSYGDVLVYLPNSTIIVRDQWIENPAGLAAMGPVVSLTDYPGPPQT